MAQAILGVGITPWGGAFLPCIINRKRTLSSLAQRFRTSHERSSTLTINDDILVWGQARWRYICTIKLTPHPPSRGSAEWATSAETSVECGNNVPYFQMKLVLCRITLAWSLSIHRSRFWMRSTVLARKSESYTKAHLY